MSIDERPEWLKRQPHESLYRRLSLAAWIVSAVVLVLVVCMQKIRLPLPDGWSTAGLPPFHASVNALVAVLLTVSVVAIRLGRVRIHRATMVAAMGCSLVFLLSYVAYHMTNDPTRFGGVGLERSVYFFLLGTHILLAAVSLPFILFSFISAWTNRFATHRKLVRWVLPMWWYVAVTGPICYWMLRPYY